MNDKIEDNPLVIMSKVQEGLDWLEEANSLVQNEEFEKSLSIVAKIIAENGNVPQPNVAAVCVKLQALNVVLRVQYSAYMSIKKGTDNANAIKNMYKEVYTGIDRLVDSMKYLVRQ